MTSVYKQRLSRGSGEERDKRVSAVSEAINQIVSQMDKDYADDEEYCFVVGLLARLLLRPNNPASIGCAYRRREDLEFPAVCVGVCQVLQQKTADLSFLRRWLRGPLCYWSIIK